MHTPTPNDCGVKETTMTPTPWKVQNGTFERGAKKIVSIDKNRNMYIMVHGGSSETRDANAAIVVNAVNSYAAMKEALEEAYEDLNFDGTYYPNQILKTVHDVRENLIKAL